MVAVPLAVLIFGTLALRISRRSSIAPSCLAGFFWIAYLGISLLLIRTTVYGISILVLMIATIQIGAFLGEHEAIGEHYPISKPPNVLRSAIVCTVLALLGIAYLVQFSVALYGLDYSLESLISIGGIWTMQRYAGFFEPWTYRFLITWFHPAALFGGIVFTLASTKKIKLLAIFTLFPPLLCTAFTGARAAFIIALACWLSGYLATLRLTGSKETFGFKRLAWVLSIAVILFGLFVMVDAIRGTQTGTKEFIAEVNEAHIIDYMFGSPPAFASWCEWGKGDYTLGAATFPSIFEAVGIKHRFLGLYEEQISVIPGYYTNVYTLFRGLIQDLSFAGAVITCFLFGYWGGSAYRRRSIWLSVFYGVIFFSPLICFFAFNGTIFAWALLACVLAKWRIPRILTAPDRQLVISYTPTPR